MVSIICILTIESDMYVFSVHPQLETATCHLEIKIEDTWYLEKSDYTSKPERTMCSIISVISLERGCFKCNETSEVSVAGNISYSTKAAINEKLGFKTN